MNNKENNSKELNEKIEILEKNYCELAEKIIESENKIKENWELFIRSKADADNFRKQSIKEIENIKKYSLEEISKDIISIIDSIEEGLNKETIKDNYNYKGLQLIHKMLIDTLKKHGVKKMDIEENEVFDPQKHEVVSIVNSEENENKIVNIFQNGYLLYDRVIRYAKISIFKKT